MPPYTIPVDGHAARFVVEQNARTFELLAASRDGDCPVWNELPAMLSGELDVMLRLHARSTFAVALAANGWLPAHQLRLGVIAGRTSQHPLTQQRFQWPALRPERCCCAGEQDCIK